MIQTTVSTSARANRLLRRRNPVLIEAFAPQSSLFRAHSRLPPFPDRHQAVPPNLPPTRRLSAVIPAPAPF